MHTKEEQVVWKRACIRIEVQKLEDFRESSQEFQGDADTWNFFGLGFFCYFLQLLHK